MNQKVEFRFDAPSARVVHLSGDFNQWTTPAVTVNPGDTIRVPIPLVLDKESGLWKTVIKLEPGRYEYKYIIDKSIWREDQNAPMKVDDIFGGKNAVIIVD